MLIVADKHKVIDLACTKFESKMTSVCREEKVFTRHVFIDQFAYVGISFIIANSYIHTYIHNCILYSVRIIDLVSHTTYVVCVNFVYKWQGASYSLKSTPNNRFFEKLFMAILF